MTTENTPKTIDLAAEAGFSLGALRVRPPLREVESNRGTDILEPRVMQVLVALTRGRGQVVSRDQLVALCWDGRAVGEDAIQRAIAKVRKVGETTGAFTIDTIARVGYRLKCDAAPTEPKPAQAPRGEPILAVLPFDNLSDDREMQFFSDGVSEEILQVLARTRGMKVIGRTSSFQFRGGDKAVANVARELGATHVLDGSVRRAEARVRISVQLIEVSSQTATWAEQFDSALSDILQVQNQIARSIARALSASLATDPAPQRVDPLAIELYLRARSFAGKNFIDEEAVAAVSLLEQAVAKAPNYAEAWGMLAANRALLLPRTHDAANTPLHVAARSAAERALALNPNSADALRALAFLKPAFAAYAEKIDLARRALELAPNDPPTLGLRWGTLAAVGRYEDAMPFMRAAMELDPLAPGYASMHALTLLSIGDTREGMSVLERACDRFPTQLTPWFFRAWATWVLTLPTREADPYFSDEPLKAGMPATDLATLRSLLAVGHLPPEHRDEAIRRFLRPDAPVLLLGIPKVAALIGCVDAAFDALFGAFASGMAIAGHGTANLGAPRSNHSMLLLQFDAKPLQADPRFARVCAHLNLAEYWMTSGRWPDCANDVPYDFRAECERAARAMP